MAAITDLSTTTSLAATDYAVVSQSGTDRKVVLGYLARSDGAAKLITGNDRELTVPVTGGTVAMVNLSQTFTAAQAIAPTPTGVNGLEVNMPASTTGKALQVKYNGSERFSLNVTAAGSSFTMNAIDAGSSYGSYVAALGNNNGSTPSAGAVILRNKNATDYSIWPDTSGKLRIGAGVPTNSTDASLGMYVGDQTSSLDSKDITGGPLGIGEVLAAVQAGADAVRRFTYKSGAYNGEEFSGVVTDYAPRYGMDRDAAHPAGRSLNEITVIGDLLIAVADLVQRVAALEAGPDA